MLNPRLGARVGGYSFHSIGLSPNIHCQLAWRTTSGSPGYGFKRQAPESSVRCLPRAPPRSRLTQSYSWQHLAFTPPFGPRSDPPSASVSVHRRKEGPLGHLRPEVLAQDGLCCPACQRLIDLIRQSGELRTLSRFPVMGAVLDIQGSHPVRSPHLPDLHC